MTWLPFLLGWIALCGGWSAMLRTTFHREPDDDEPLYHVAVWSLLAFAAFIWWTIVDVLG